MHAALDALVQSVREHQHASLYKDLWGAAVSFAELPAASAHDLAKTPLTQRRYKQARSLMKWVQGKNFLIEWAFEDIAQESLPLCGTRPFIYIEDPYEAVAQGMWCYEHNLIPLVGERDADIATTTAEAYQVDSVITDPTSLPQLLPYFERRDVVLESLVLLAPTFDESIVQHPLQTYAKEVHLVLSSPETGTYATALFQSTLQFKLAPQCILEYADTPLLTKVVPLVTPIIRYQVSHGLPRELFLLA